MKLCVRISAGATIRRTRRLPRASGQKRRQKSSCVVQKVTNVHQRKGMNMMKVNETHDHAVYEKIKALHYFRFAAEGLIFFLLNFNSTYTRQAMSQFGINLIHVINFSNVQNVLRSSVMYAMSRVRISVHKGDRWKRSCLECSQAYK